MKNSWLMEPIWFTPPDGSGMGLWKDSPSPPAAPDYLGAAQAQGAANKEAATATLQGSNPNVTNPYGGQQVTWTKDPDTGNMIPNINQYLSESGQQLFNQYQGINQGLGDVATQGLGYVQDTLDTPFDFGALPSAPVNAGQSYTDAAFARLQPNIDRSQKALDTQLANQGITQGSEAWKNAQTQQQQGVNDQRAAITTSSIGQDQAARQAAIQEQEFGRTEPLNILNAVRSSAPVNVPQFQGYQGTTQQPTPVMAGAQAQGQADQNMYNLQQAGANSFNSGLFGLGSAALMGFSDRRLKSNVKRIGTHHGLGVYEYDIAGIRTQGVMADEVLAVMPEAVSTAPSGFMLVDYGRL